MIGRITPENHLVTVCGAGTCPTVYEADPETVVVQGYRASAFDGPDGVSGVEIPIELLQQYASLKGITTTQEPQPEPEPQG